MESEWRCVTILVGLSEYNCTEIAKSLNMHYNNTCTLMRNLDL